VLSDLVGKLRGGGGRTAAFIGKTLMVGRANRKGGRSFRDQRRGDAEKCASLKISDCVERNKIKLPLGERKD